MFNLTMHTRKRLYQFSIAFLGLLAVTGYVTEEIGTAFSLLLAPVFGIALTNMNGDNEGNE